VIIAEVERQMPAAERIPRKMGPPSSKAPAIRAALLDNPRQTNDEVARKVGCHPSYVSDIRSRFGFPTVRKPKPIGKVRRLAAQMLLAEPMRRGRVQEVADALGVSRGCIYAIWFRIKPAGAVDLRRAK
jgi:hypothetical protein